MKLHDLTLAACAALGITSGCELMEQETRQVEVKKTIEEEVKQAIDAFSTGAYKKAFEILKTYRAKEEKDKKDDNYIFNPTVSCLLALAYANDWNLPSAQTELWQFVGIMEKAPKRMKEVQSQLEDFCKGETYQKIDSAIAEYSRLPFLGQLEGVRALMRIIKQDYEEARDHLKIALSSFGSPDKQRLQAIIGRLSGAASKEKDYNRMVGYSIVQEAFNN